MGDEHKATFDMQKFNEGCRHAQACVRLVEDFGGDPKSVREMLEVYTKMNRVGILDVSNLISEYVDVAALRALVAAAKDWDRDTKITDYSSDGVEMHLRIAVLALRKPAEPVTCKVCGGKGSIEEYFGHNDAFSRDVSCPACKHIRKPAEKGVTDE